MDDQKYFKKYQWIDADVARALSDVRPESYRINPDTIVVGDFIPTKRGGWHARAEWIMHPDNILSSVESLQKKQVQDHTSLGLVKPKQVSKITVERVSDAERTKFKDRWDDITRQYDLPTDPGTRTEILPLRGTEYRFKVLFRCDDSECQKGHEFSVLDWDIDALYFKQRQDRGPQMACNKVIEKLRDEVCASNKDLYFFLGNIATHPHVFTIVGFWYPRRKEVSAQMSLL